MINSSITFFKEIQIKILEVNSLLFKEYSGNNKTRQSSYAHRPYHFKGRKYNKRSKSGMSNNKYNDLDQLVKKIIHSTNSSELSKTIQEIESNKEYITEVQLKKLKKMHDTSFRLKCVTPTQELYDKYLKRMEKDGNLQNRAAEIDRDLRIIETALDIIKEK